MSATMLINAFQKYSKVLEITIESKSEKAMKKGYGISIQKSCTTELDLKGNENIKVDLSE